MTQFIIVAFMVVAALIGGTKVVSTPKPTSSPVPQVLSETIQTTPTPQPISIEDFNKMLLDNGEQGIIATPDPNEAIHCPIDAACGGGTTPLKRYECERSVCCDLIGEFKFFNDREECRQAFIEKFKTNTLQSQATPNNTDQQKAYDEAKQKYEDYLALLKQQEELRAVKQKEQIEKYNNDVVEYCNQMADIAYPSRSAGASSNQGYVVGQNMSESGKRSSYYQSCVSSLSIVQ